MNTVTPTPAIEKALASLLENPRNEAVWARFRRVVLMEAGRAKKNGGGQESRPMDNATQGG